MTAKFDVKTCARSLSKLMATADVTITKPGGALHTQRLIDYCSNEFQRMSEEQCTAVLQSIDKNYQTKVLSDGNGGILGYLYSRKVFVLLRKDQQHSQHTFDYASAFVNNNKKRAIRSKATSKPRSKARAKAKKK